MICFTFIYSYLTTIPLQFNELIITSIIKIEWYICTKYIKWLKWGSSHIACPPLRTTIDTGRPRVAGGVAHWFFISRKSLNICTWSSAPYTVTEKLQYIIKGPMKVISELLPETWGYFCIKNCINHWHWQTEGCRWSGPLIFYIRALKYVGLSDLL
jgi:hypothetical protein